MVTLYVECVAIPVARVHVQREIPGNTKTFWHGGQRVQ